MKVLSPVQFFGLLILIIGVGIGVLMLRFGGVTPPVLRSDNIVITGNTFTNRFAVGDCITTTGHHEAWEHRVVLRVKEIGEQAYRVEYRMDDGTFSGGAWWVDDQARTHHIATLSFTDSKYYQKVPCP